MRERTRIAVAACGLWSATAAWMLLGNLVIPVPEQHRGEIEFFLIGAMIWLLGVGAAGFAIVVMRHLVGKDRVA